MSATVINTVERFQNQVYEEAENNTGSREFRVLISAPDVQGASIALSSADIPARGSSWNGMKCATRNAKLMDANCRTAYLVTCKYSDAVDSSSFEAEKYPWQEDPISSFDFVAYPKILYKDLSPEKKPILNSAGDMFETGQMTNSINMKFTLTRNTQNYNPDTAWSLIDSINEESLSIGRMSIGSEMARLLRWSGQEQKYTDKQGVEHTYYSEVLEFELSGDNEDGFDLVLQDAGYYEWKDGKKVRITLSDGKTPASTAQLLNGSGIAILDKNATPVTRSFQQFKKMSWSAI